MLSVLLLLIIFVLIFNRQNLHKEAYDYADPWRAAFMEMEAADPYLYQI